jgi:hypothetical protein
MIISKNHLQSICNYTEVSSIKNPQFSYLEMEESNSDDYKRRIQSINRGLAIDALLDNKEEEYKNRETYLEQTFDSEGYVSTISPKIKTISLKNPIKYNSLDSIFDYTLNQLESLTSNSMTGKNIDLTLSIDHSLSDYDNLQANTRRVLTRIMLVNNMITQTSRVGPASSIIIGEDVFNIISQSSNFSYQVSGTGPIKGTISGLSVIFSEKLNKNKVILIRTNSQSQSDIGLNVINDMQNGEFYIKETPNWQKMIHWFSVI